MDDQSAREALRRFGIGVHDVQQVHTRADRVVWQVTGGQRDYALKWLNQSKTARKIAAVARFLRRKGIPTVPVLPAVDGKPWVCGKEGCFLLFPWVSARRPRYDEDPGMLARMMTLLAQFHEASLGYVASGSPRCGSLLNWPTLYAREIAALKNFGQRASDTNDQFSQLFRSEYAWLRSRGAWAAKQLSHSAFDSLVTAANRDPILGHGDWARANLLIDDYGKLTIIDLDTVGVALPVSDLSSFIPLIDHDLQNWSESRFRQLLAAYRRIRPLSDAELELLLIDQVFPFQVLRLAKSYYEHKWGSPSPTLLAELERCLRTDQAKLLSLGVGPR